MSKSEEARHQKRLVTLVISNYWILWDIEMKKNEKLIKKEFADLGVSFIK